MNKMGIVLRKMRGTFDACFAGSGMPATVAAAAPNYGGGFTGMTVLLIPLLIVLAVIAATLSVVLHGAPVLHLAHAGSATAFAGLAIGQTTEVELKKLHDELNNVTKTFRETNDALEAERKKLGHETSETKSLLDKLNGRLDEIEVKMQRARLGGTGEADEQSRVASETKRFNTFARFGEERLSDAELKALSTDSDADGGFVNFPNFSDRLIKKLYLISPFRNLATVETISKGNALSIPAEGSTNFDAGRVGQRQARTETTEGSLRMEEIPTHEYYAAPQITQQMIDDGAIDVETWCAERVGDRFAQITGADYINGTGVRQPEGVMTNSSIASVVSGSASAITMDGMFDLMAALPTYYAQQASIICNRKTTYALRKLKDGQQRYLWEPSPIVGNPPSFDGKPVIEMPDMPDIGASTYPVAFGDWKKAYTIVDRQSVRLIRDALTNKPFVILYFTLRTGGQITLAEAAVKLQCHT